MILASPLFLSKAQQANKCVAKSSFILDAAFKRCGVLRVNKIRDVFEIIELLGKQPIPR